MKIRHTFFIFFLVLVFSCIKNENQTEDNLAGGETTIFSQGPDAYSLPADNIGIYAKEHLDADGIFAQQFVSAPSVIFGGLGPVFNQNSCQSCHVRNGRGNPLESPSDQNSGLLLRLSMSGVGLNGGIIPVPDFGGQLQTKSIFGSSPEGQISIQKIDKIVEFLSGEKTILNRNIYAVSNPYKSFPAGALVSPRIAPPVFGLGLIEAIPTLQILANEDEFDKDGDGISGKANRVWDPIRKHLSIGLFGWKAEQPNALLQAADAAHNDMGLTSFVFPKEASHGQSNANNGLQTSDDIDEATVKSMAFYFQTLGVPAHRNSNTPSVNSGRLIFNKLQCQKCHIAEFTTDIHEISILSNQRIKPYSDFLLHDLGSDLADNRPVFSANGNEWRTPPLWGLGLAQIVNPKAKYLHDGRAATIEEAILWHGGEAENSKKNYIQLSKNDRELLLKFLNSL